MSKRAVLICLLTFSGCASAAWDSASTRYETCISAVVRDPEFQPLSARFPLNAAGEASAAQRASRDIPTENEARLMAIRMDGLTPCRSEFLQDVAKISAGQAGIRVRAFGEADEATMAIIRRETTWGAYLSRIQSLNARVQAQSMEMVQAGRNALLASGAFNVQPLPYAPAMPPSFSATCMPMGAGMLNCRGR